MCLKCKCLSSPDSSVLDRLLALENMMMGSAERERLSLLKTVAQSRKEIQVSYTLSAFGPIAWSEQHLY